MTATGHRRPAWGVAAPHAAAADAAAAVLDSGGTAVDGAIAAAGVLAVVYPHNCSVGGDLIALVRSAGEPPKAVFGVGRSASRTTASDVRRRFGTRVPVEGPYSISVPGVVSGWQQMHQMGGSRPLDALLQPAVRLAADGFSVSPSLAHALQELRSDDPGLAEVFGPPGRRAAVGDTVVQARLAETLAQVASDPESYYRGDLGRALAKGLEEAGSLITADDFAAHRAVAGEAETTDAGALAPRLFTAGLPSQGVFFATLAAIAGRLVDRGRRLADGDAALLARAFSEISAVRDSLLSDPSRSPGPDRIGEAIAELDLLGQRPGVGSEEAEAARTGRAGRAGRAASSAAPPSGDTVAVVCVDGCGNSVSLLQSVFHSFGSHMLDPGTGVLFHSRQSMFTLEPGAPGELGPGLMPPHTLCPAMVDTADGLPSIVLGTMGGRAQPQVLTQVLLQLATGRDAGQAVAAPRYIVGDTEDPLAYRTVTAEGGVSEAALESMAEGGFDVHVLPASTEDAGHAQLLRVGAHGVMDGASDPRADGAALLGS